MFSTEKTFEIRIISGGVKICKLRWPTDAEWCTRSKRLRTVRRFVGTGQATTEVAGAARADAELFELIRIDKDGASFDEAEASRAIGKLEAATSTVELEGDVYVVTLAVPGGEVRHRLKIPRQSDIAEYARGAVKRTEERRSIVTTVNLEAGGVLWGKISDGTEGYAEGSGVPVTHKDLAVSEMLALLQSEEDELGEA